MKWKIRTLLLIVMALLTVVLPISITLADSFTLYEYYTTGPDLSSELYVANYFAQTFTVGSLAHTVDRVRLNLSAEGVTPGNLYVSIRATTTAGVPNGVDLSTGVFLGSLLTVSTTVGAMYEINMSSYTLAANTKYAIVCYGTGTTDALNIHWYLDNSSPSYTGGSAFSSTTAGINWTANTSRDFMFEVYGSTGITQVTHARVFSDYKASGDWLVVLAYNCAVSPYYPYYPSEEYWTIQLLNAAGTVVAQNPLLQWGKRPGSIYISPVGATALEWGNPAYSVRIAAKYNSLVNASYTLDATAWYGNTLSMLDSWCLTFANEMDNNDNPIIPYISETVEYGPMLSLGAGVIFDIGISELSVVRPNIFEAKIEEFAEWQDSTFTNTYANTLDDWQTSVGPELHQYFDDAGALIGMDGRYIGGLLVFIGFIALAALAVTTGHLTAGATLASIALFGGVVIGLIPIAVVFVYIVLLAIMFVKNYWFGGT
jgi:hypothetical protein